jgi:multisubunit Na+/H+ antiporter MnhB subunit
MLAVISYQSIPNGANLVNVRLVGVFIGDIVAHLIVYSVMTPKISEDYKTPREGLSPY